MADSNLSRLVESALTNLKTMAEADTVIGKPVEIPGGSTVIPVSKITVGFTSGGIDYTSKNKPDNPPNFGGGTGTGYTITPVAFLVIDMEGDVRLLNVNDGGGKNSGSLAVTIADLAAAAPDILEKTIRVFKKDKPEKARETTPEKEAE
ncbi:MAG: sporulation protein YtfJ [Oscillospiraceae bacterium]|nr:sporulation protein YtfJ [Oscillospiraceae bacterium]